MKRHFACFVAAVGTIASADAQVSVRYFLSFQGLSNPNNTDSAAVFPANIGADPILESGPGVTRLYLWADISGSPAPTDLKGFSLGFRSTGSMQIVRTNIWQNNFTLPGFTRWNAAGFPGEQTWNAQTATPGPTVAVLEQGVTTGLFAPFDDQMVAARALVGFVEVQGVGDLHIINNGTGFLQGSSSSNRVYIGFHDAIGAPAEVVGTPYDNAQPEAYIPEPSSLALLGLAAAFGLRRR